MAFSAVIVDSLCGCMPDELVDLFSQTAYPGGPISGMSHRRSCW
jgi:hypothetical protein